MKWKLDRLGQGGAFHLRGGQIIDAIGFTNSYLAEHPRERAVVVVILDPEYGRVTQAVAAYTRGTELRVVSSGLGDLALKGLSSADIADPEKIKTKLNEIRARNIEAYDSALSMLGDPVTKVAARLILKSPAVAIAHAEENNDYRSFDGNGLISQTDDLGRSLFLPRVSAMDWPVWPMLRSLIQPISASRCPA